MASKFLLSPETTTKEKEQTMSPPFDTERTMNENFNKLDLPNDEFQGQDQEFAAEVFPAEAEVEEEEETEQEKPDTSLGSVQQYLHDIGSVALLSREREIELAKEVESAT